MAMTYEHDPITSLDQWYETYILDERDGTVRTSVASECAVKLMRMFERYKTDTDKRLASHWKLEKLGAGEVLTEREDFPNVSSGEIAGMIRRTARNLVQNTPNVEIKNQFDDDSAAGAFARYILLTKIIGSDEYSNDMQQNLFASAKSALTLGFDCVIPVLTKNYKDSWHMKYDSIHYRDVFPDPGVKDVREAPSVFIRRYLTKGQIKGLVESNAPGWDLAALRTLAMKQAPNYQNESKSHEDNRRGFTPEGYEIITWYSDSGAPFLTFSRAHKMLLRIETNLHPHHQHPIHFMVLEKDAHQPFGKSQVELVLGRQEFQDLMLNGAMKAWYLNIDPPLLGFGTNNEAVNLGPGKLTTFDNPNSRLEVLDTNTQTLLQYGNIAQQNRTSMVDTLGAADQTMATQGGGQVSNTPQGVAMQQAMIDITTNNYQKSIESLFSHYCSHALTTYFQELKSVKTVKVSADTRTELLDAGVPPEKFNEAGEFDIDMSKMAVDYYVRCIPGSLIELEDEKQMRILNDIFVPLSQALPALANANDPENLSHAVAAMRFIIEKQIELSGSAHSKILKNVFTGTDEQQLALFKEKTKNLEDGINGLGEQIVRGQEQATEAITGIKAQLAQQAQINEALMQHLGISNAEPAPQAVQEPAA